MKKHVFLIVIAFIALLFFSETQISQLYSMPETAVLEMADISSIRGMYVSSNNNTDYPSKPNMLADEMTNEAKKIVNTAKENGFNSIFFEAVHNGSSMYASEYYPNSEFWKEADSFHYSDPLKTLYSEAVRQGIHVFAVVDMSSEAAHYDEEEYQQKLELMLASTNELIDKYGVSGLLMIDSSENSKNSVKIVAECAASAHKSNSEVIFGYGIVLDTFPNQKIDNISTLISNKNIDFISPVMKSDFDVSVTSNKNNYTVFFNNSENKPVVPVHIFTQANNEHIIDKFSARIFADAQQGVSGEIIGGYAVLSYSDNSLIDKLAKIESSLANLDINYSDLKLPQKLIVTYPQDGFKTTEPYIYVTGFSQPSNELTVNKNPVVSRGKNGSFGVLLELTPGQNTFEFEQAERFLSLNIERVDSSELNQQITQKIQPDTAFPYFDFAVRNGKSVVLSCTAPSQGSVTARMGERTYALRQENTNIERGIPTKYSVEIPIKHQNVKQSETVKLGKVTYSLTYDGIVTNQKSSGELYVMGSRADLAVGVSRYSADIFTQPNENAPVLTILKNGAKDFAVGSVGDYYELESGGFILKNNVSILTGVNEVEQPVENVLLQSDERNERLIFIGGSGLPLHLSYNQFDRTVTLTVFHGEGLPDILAHLESELFSSIDIEKDTSINKAVLTLKLAENAQLWGYNAEYSEQNLEITFKKAPVQSDAAQPLKGIKIMIDAGHGGKDIGAVGTANSYGPQEKDLTLITGKFLKDMLEFWGAEVYMTRSDDSYIMGDARLQMVSSLNVDMVISLHCSNSAPNSNIYSMYGVEALYSNIFSKEITAETLTRLSKDTGRTNRGTIYANTSDGIMKTTLCPAMRINIGYLSNPAEYDKLCNLYELHRIAESIALSVKDYMVQT